MVGFIAIVCKTERLLGLAIAAGLFKSALAVEVYGPGTASIPSQKIWPDGEYQQQRALALKQMVAQVRWRVEHERQRLLAFEKCWSNLISLAFFSFAI